MTNRIAPTTQSLNDGDERSYGRSRCVDDGAHIAFQVAGDTPSVRSGLRYVQTKSK